jgi:hypothetical protein
MPSIQQKQAAAAENYRQHHAPKITEEQRTAVESKVKQQAQKAEQKRQESNAKADTTPGATYTPPPQPQVASNRALPHGAADPRSPPVCTPTASPPT